MRPQRSIQHKIERNETWLIHERKRPTEDRMREIEAIYWDTEAMRVYCDCSCPVTHTPAVFGKFGIGIASVFNGEVTIRSTTHLNPFNENRTDFGEIVAVKFAIQQIPHVLKTAMSHPMKVVVYSDVPIVNDVLNQKIWTNIPQAIRLVEESKRALKKFEEAFPHIELVIEVLEKKEKKHNPLYTAAHNAARKAIGIRRP